MRYWILLGAAALAALSLSAARAQVFDPAKYPDMAGQWGESHVNKWAPGEKPVFLPSYIQAKSSSGSPLL